MAAYEIQNPSYLTLPHPASGRFTSFQAFYPFYLGEHANKTCRRLHVVGTSFVTGTIIYAITTATASALKWVPVLGYGFAWAGHFFFEKNKPATFKYPLWSLMGDFKMFWEVISGKRVF
ncbi:hypothetical protein SpCBS45565_g07527 [Spizellomyces sp. 'palustris']|nr:hypothetical protein SpCBS45565_g07527 [Spizellomyces sp. 'palustris']